MTINFSLLLIHDVQIDLFSRQVSKLAVYVDGESKKVRNVSCHSWVV